MKLSGHERHNTIDNSSNEEKKVIHHGRDPYVILGKFFWELFGKLIILGLVTQVTAVQASETNVTQRNSSPGVSLTIQSTVFTLSGNTNSIDSWAYKIRNNDYHEIIEFAKECNNAINSNLDQLIEKAYAKNSENAETIINFIRDLPCIENTAVAYSSLFKQMKSNNHLDNYILLMLAYRIKELMAMENYPNFSQIYKDNCESIKFELPRSVRHLIWNGDSCTLKSTVHKEYLYAASDDLSYPERRRVFTWRPRSTADSTCYWKIKPVKNGNSFTMQSVHYNGEYLYAGYDGNAYDDKRRRVFTWRPGTVDETCHWKITPTNNGNFFTIQTTYYNEEYLYADSDEFAYDANRRRVFTWRPGGSKFYWEINC